MTTRHGYHANKKRIKTSQLHRNSQPRRCSSKASRSCEVFGSHEAVVVNRWLYDGCMIDQDNGIDVLRGTRIMVFRHESWWLGGKAPSTSYTSREIKNSSFECMSYGPANTSDGIFVSIHACSWGQGTCSALCHDLWCVDSKYLVSSHLIGQGFLGCVLHGQGFQSHPLFSPTSFLRTSFRHYKQMLESPCRHPCDSAMKRPRQWWQKQSLSTMRQWTFLSPHPSSFPTARQCTA